MAVVAGVVHGVGGSAALFLPGRVLPDACRGSANAALHRLRLPHSTKARNCRPHLRRLVSVPVFDRLLSSQSIVMSVSVRVCGGEVCLSASISPELHVQSSPNFCACYLWPWLGPPLVSFLFLFFFMFLCFTDRSCGCVFFQ